MKYLVTSGEMKACDKNTIERIGIPGPVLMERAALAVRDEIRKQNKNTVLIFAGTGNNGGDGLALARLLCEDGMRVTVCIVGDENKATEQWKLQKAILDSFEIKYKSDIGYEEYDLYVDAFFGVGLTRAVDGKYAELINECNKKDGIKVAVDIPSGVNADTGEILGCAFEADITVTFAFEKRGLYMYPGCTCAGKIVLADVGISELGFCGHFPQMYTYDEDIRELLPERAQDGNKGTFGKVLIIAGSVNMAGAAVLAAKACYRAGAGMVKVMTCEENRTILQQAVPEALFGTYECLQSSLEWADVVAIGPGLSQSREAADVLEYVLKFTSSEQSLLVDADALNLIADNDFLKNALSKEGKSGKNIVLTPHVGELSRLTGRTVSELKKDLSKAGMKFSEETNCTVVCKDARTFVCGHNKEKIFMNICGNSGMATAGSGDVLAGCIAGLMAQGQDPYTAATVGVYAAAVAGDRAAQKKSEYAITAGDIVENLMQ